MHIFFTSQTFYFAVALVITINLALSKSQSCPSADVCVHQAPYKNVTITTDSTYRYITTSQCPPYQNPQWSNPSVACSRPTTHRIPLHPRNAATAIPVGEGQLVWNDILYLREDPSPIFGAMGVLLNGVNIFGVGSPCGFSSKCPENGGPSKYVDAVDSEGHTTDQCGGHADPHHNYHIHSQTGFNASKIDGRQKCQLPVDVPGKHSQLLGWMFDGYGIYGQFSEDGKVPTNLDECGGHTHNINGVSVYHYHFPYPSEFPWTIHCFKGCPEVSNNPHEFSGFTKYGC